VTSVTPGLETIDCFTGRSAISLGADHPTVGVHVGLCDDGPVHRQIAVSGQSHSGMRNWSAGAPAEICDFAFRILGRIFGESTVRGYLHIEAIG
jgi:hypothetical protein